MLAQKLSSARLLCAATRRQYATRKLLARPGLSTHTLSFNPARTTEIPRIGPHNSHLFLQRRGLLGGIFRVARTGITAGAGAVFGGVAYINYKVGEIGSSTSDYLSKAKDWLDGTLNQISEAGDGPPVYDAKAKSEPPGSSSEQSNSEGNSEGSENGQSSNGGGGNGIESEIVSAAAVAAVSTDQDDQMMLLTRNMIEIRNILLQIDDSDSLKLPSIAVIGSQSSGKSSVLEAIVGHEFLPKGGNMVTRRPIELTLVYSPDTLVEYCEFPTLKLGRLTDFKHVQRTLTELNLAVSPAEVVSDDPIQMTIRSPHVPDLTLIDLPGYIQVISEDQPLDLKDRIEHLVYKYIQEPNVILAVSAADVDLANSTALRQSRMVDPSGSRTIGVITKLDLVEQERGYEILKHNKYPLSMGYVGVMTRSPSTAASGDFSHQDSNMTQAIAQSENTFFNARKSYADLDCGVLRLRSKLTAVLEKNMSDSLAPAAQAIRNEVDETSYLLKVEFNDRVLTPATYLAQSLDSFKAAFKSLSTSFTREDVRELLRSNLDQKVLDVLASRYWNSPSEDDPPSVIPLSDLSTANFQTLYWQNKLEQASSSITKLGFGRYSSTLLVKEIEKRMTDLAAETAFAKHPSALKAVQEATTRILNQRAYSTTEQVENAIKPYKYEVEVDDREWSSAREHSYNLLKEELRQCQGTLSELKRTIGASKLLKVMAYVEHLRKGSVVDHLNFSPQLLEKGREAVFLRDRGDIIQMRMLAVKSKTCLFKQNRAQCPEVLLDVVAEKLTSTAVLFLNFELLSDFYYSFPRELDSAFAALNQDEIERFSNEDPRVQRHVALQRRKDLLQLALRKIQAVSELQPRRSGSL